MNFFFERFCEMVDDCECIEMVDHMRDLIDSTELVTNDEKDTLLERCDDMERVIESGECR